VLAISAHTSPAEKYCFMAQSALAVAMLALTALLCRRKFFVTKATSLALSLNI